MASFTSSVLLVVALQLSTAYSYDFCRPDIVQAWANLTRPPKPALPNFSNYKIWVASAVAADVEGFESSLHEIGQAHGYFALSNVTLKTTNGTTIDLKLLYVESLSDTFFKSYYYFEEPFTFAEDAEVHAALCEGLIIAYKCTRLNNANGQPQIVFFAPLDMTEEAVQAPLATCKTTVQNLLPNYTLTWGDLKRPLLE